MNEGSKALATSPEVRPAAAWIRVVISIFVVFHLSCIIINVSAAGSGEYQAPMVIQKLHARHGIVRGYLGALFQTNAYRFYAPNPGPCDLLWVRFKYADPNDPQREIVATRWHEMPAREEHFWRMAFQRDLAACMLLSHFVEPVTAQDPQAFGQPRMMLQLNPAGRIVFASYLRHLTRQERFREYRPAQGGPTLELVGVDAFKVAHNILAPNDAKLRVSYTDPRFYEVFFMGRFRPDGSREEDSDDPFIQQSMEDLFARLVQEDLQPLVERLGVKIEDSGDMAKLIAESGLPKPFRTTLAENPSLLKPFQTRAEIARRFFDAVIAKDDPEVKRQLGLETELDRQLRNAGSLPIPNAPGAPDQSLQNRVAPSQQSGRSSSSVR